MPLYRKAGLMRRLGGDISSNTIAASIVCVGLATQPVINLMRDALLDADLIYLLRRDDIRGPEGEGAQATYKFHSYPAVRFCAATSVCYG